jgi:hypothetical protein
LEPGELRLQWPRPVSRGRGKSEPETGQLKHTTAATGPATTPPCPSGSARSSDECRCPQRLRLAALLFLDSRRQLRRCRCPGFTGRRTPRPGAGGEPVARHRGM